ncbi:MAG: hypothetical protein M1820_000892 [Bogoriella megaspora]|nr:MAG: hypothetical protein M1820_000892 [Bogoriella megaspora]
MANVSDKVDFTLSFIGTPTDNDDGVDCKHGPSECLGNILELCAAELYPDPKIYLGFAMCLTGHYEDIPSRDLITDCSLEHGLDFEKLNNCVSQDDGEHGISLLRTSVKRTADANVTKSCTVRLNGQIRTIRDGGRWKDYEGGHDPEELVSDIQKLYKMSDEDWVPRRGPQPANAKAAYTKTAKGEKPTKIPVLTQTTKQSTDAAIEAETTAQSDDPDTKTDEVSSSSAVTTIPEDLFTTTTDTADSWEVTTLPDDLPPSPPSISPTGTLTPLEPYSALTETSSTTSSATTS